MSGDPRQNQKIEGSSIESSQVQLGQAKGDLTQVQGSNNWVLKFAINLFGNQQASSRQEYRNRKALLDKVRRSWIEGVLERSLFDRAQIELGLERRFDALALDYETPEQLRQPLPKGIKVSERFFEQLGVGRTLLILGNPGAGKTTTLLELARDLLLRGECDANLPSPVVFNLSSWIDPKQPIADWLVQELNSKYQVSKSLGRIWIKEQQLFLLLDGLDEVRVEIREDCVKAINQFTQKYGQTETVVCSRIADYEAISQRFRFQTAIFVQPLSDEQVKDYLNQAGEKLIGLKTALQKDAVLQELTHTPLMLSVMVLAYEDFSVEELPEISLKERRKHLFDKYIDRMFQRRRMSLLYAKEQAVRWLIWLAQQMKQESKTIFLIENMQPTLLRGKSERLTYKSINFLIIGLIVKFVGGLAIGLTLGLISGLIAQQVFGLRYGLVTGVGSGLFSGLMIWLSGSTEYSSKEIEPFSKSLSWSWRNSKIGFISGLILGSYFAFASDNNNRLLENSEIFLTLTNILFVGLFFGWLGGLSGRDEGCNLFGKVIELVVKEAKEIIVLFLYGRIKQAFRKVKTNIEFLHTSSSLLCQEAKSKRPNVKIEETVEEIRLIEKISWSWKKSKTGFLIYLLGGGLIFSLYLLSPYAVKIMENVFSSYKLTNEELIQVKGVAIWISLLILLSFSVISGFNISELEKKTMPNQGIWNSAKNFTIISLIFGFWKTTTGLLVGLLIGSLFTRSESFEAIRSAALNVGLNLELIIGLGGGIFWGILSGFMHGLEYGCKTCLKHFSLRLVLFSRKHIPWNYARFLNFAAERLFLQKVGGGYIFIHRMLMEHFAQMGQDS